MHTESKTQIAIIIATLVAVIIAYLYYTGLYIKIITSQNMINPTSNKYPLTSGFGYRTHPITQSRTYHNGEDYATPLNTPLLAPSDGVVVLVENHATGGLQVVIKHDNGFQTGYAHLASALVSKGQRVSKGDVFAYTGNSGASTGPHLHLTLRNPGGARIAPSTIFYK